MATFWATFSLSKVIIFSLKLLDDFQKWSFYGRHFGIFGLEHGLGYFLKNWAIKKLLITLL
jgi:hypothetical protein